MAGMDGLEALVLVMVAMIQTTGSTVGAVFAVKAHRKARAAHREAQEVNDAVNHRHEHASVEAGGDVPPRLYDAVLDLRTEVRELTQWQARWKEMPTVLGDAAHVVRWRDHVEGRLRDHDYDLAELREIVRRP